MEALEDKIKRFLLIGSGYGSGDGSGDGYGDGSGDGDGDGYGSGSGYGSGDGSGDGDGDGYGYGLHTLDGERIYIIDGLQTIIRSIHSTYAVGVILNDDLTLTHTYIAKVGNCFAHGDTLRQARESAEAKALQNEPIEQRILRFKAQYPDNNKKIPAMELFKWHNILTGSCEQGRRNFALNKGIDLDNDSFTIQEFVEITKNSYGGDIIKQILL